MLGSTGSCSGFLAGWGSIGLDSGIFEGWIGPIEVVSVIPVDVDKLDNLESCSHWEMNDNPYWLVALPADLPKKEVALQKKCHHKICVFQNKV